MFDKRTGDEQCVWHDFVRSAANDRFSIANGDIVDLVTVFAVAVLGDRTFKALKDNIGNPEICCIRFRQLW